MVSIDIKISRNINKPLKIKKQNLKEALLKCGIIYTQEKVEIDKFEKLSFKSVIKKLNGILIKEDKKFIYIAVDPFRTIPLFICKSNNNIFISSDIKRCIQRNSSNEIDRAGFWELIKYGICLGNRTLFANIKQLPGASFLKICKSDLSLSYNSYWNYRVTQNQKITSINQAISKLDKLLKKTISNKINQSSNKKFCMGISGGLDSRLSLNYLCSFLNPENLQLFTFANNNLSLEYVYAKKIVKSTRFRKPFFYRLKDQDYLDSLNELPVISAGLMNFIHGHISNCLRKIPKLKKIKPVQISNYFSDAIFGWSTISPSEKVKIGFDKMVAEIMKDDHIPEKTKYIICDDLSNLYARGEFKLKGNGPYSSFFEYYYLVEKNIKLHSYLLFLQSYHLPALALYADYDLARFMLSISHKLKRGKNIIYHLLDTRSKFSKKNIDNISSRDFRGSTNKLSFKSLTGIKFKLSNFVNTIYVYSGLNIRGLNSVFQTENILSVYYCNFKDKTRKTLEMLYKNGLISDKSTYKRFLTNPYNIAKIGENMQFLSICYGLKKIKNYLSKINM